MTKHALLLVAQGSEEMETVITADILRRAQIHVTISAVYSTANNIVECSRQVKLAADTHLKAPSAEEFDMLILPGGLKGAETFGAKNEDVQALIRRFEASGKFVAAICAAPIALQAAGVFKGKKITSYPTVKEKLHDYVYLEERVVVDGKLITSRGPGTAIDFGIAIVTVLKGSEAAKQVYEPMLIPSGTKILQ